MSIVKETINKQGISIPDLSDCAVLPVELNGAQSKLVVLYNHERYIIKYNIHDYIGEHRNNVSEYLAYKFCKYLQIPCQEVFLCNYKGKKACAIKIFTKFNESIHSFYEINMSSVSGLDADVKDIPYNLDLILYTLEHYKDITVSKQDLNHYFWNMFCVDTVLGNFDRHWGNWGFIGSTKNYIKLAPLFDNGACLFPRLNGINLKNVYKDSGEMLKRVNNFPLSQIRIKGRKRTYDYLIDYCLDLNLGIHNSLDYFCTMYDTKKIDNLFEDDSLVVFTTVEEREFLKNIIKLRYRYLLIDKRR